MVEFVILAKCCHCGYLSAKFGVVFLILVCLGCFCVCFSIFYMFGGGKLPYNLDFKGV